ncbi:NAD-dependent succinate-semialdehyde dehydrogenase [Paraburkholderia acidisoli]|uniref:Aldehyde dehydrogenase family protein n=1 Tax=Paraburkholderia acidisoli TaxID=2571748 RepID=A0A7Z2JGJ6_9BURK|nr:NAD-dependent succinate-semialdehyde dehydrogenase [Paraburkholderia acidisoli]QGZ63083.1 aldehyde dehydrogenase family protein [Paraburkholderia acidisoli]
MKSDVAGLQESSVSRNPATGEIIRTWPFQTPDEVEQMLAANAAAAKAWRATPMSERVACYRRLAATLRERLETLALLATHEMGKTLVAARAEVEKCASAVDWIAEHGPAILADEPAPVDNGDRVYVSFLPIGTVLAVMPWNFPFWQVMRAAGPIMLSGNGFILKHAPNVMGCAYALQEAFEASGFPKGVVGVLHVGNEMVARVIQDPRTAAVTVTGSMRAGSAVASIAGKALKKSLLELGGADAYIVLADADIDRAVEVGIEARFQNAGQVCLAAKRFILERPIAEEFTRKYVSAAARVKAGDPLDPATTIGPIARDDLRAGVHDQVVRTLAAGAKALLGGKNVDGPGFFYEPTVLGDVAPGMAAFDEEVFGPVAALTVANDLEDAIRLANLSDYGLSGNLWTSDLARASEIARRLETGGVFVNGFSASNPRLPVGGVKQSGYGRELSHFGLREFVNAQGVWVKKVS